MSAIKLSNVEIHRRGTIEGFPTEQIAYSVDEKIKMLTEIRTQAKSNVNSIKDNFSEDLDYEFILQDNRHGTKWHYSLWDSEIMVPYDKEEVLNFFGIKED